VIGTAEQEGEETETEETAEAETAVVSGAASERATLTSNLLDLKVCQQEMQQPIFSQHRHFCNNSNRPQLQHSHHLLRE